VVFLSIFSWCSPYDHNDIIKKLWQDYPLLPLLFFGVVIIVVIVVVVVFVIIAIDVIVDVVVS
jgi:hypothetical protein